jgi:hypothetical protein
MDLNTKDGAIRWQRALILRRLGRTDEATANAIAAVETDVSVLSDKKPILAERGYLPVRTSINKLSPSMIRDAVSACMLDERCG